MLSPLEFAMFEVAIRLIVAHAYPICEYTDPERAQEVLSAQLHAAMHTAFPCKRKETLKAIRRFVDSSAWSMLWTLIKAEWVDNEELTLARMADLRNSLYEHFQPIEEEMHGHQANHH